VFLVKLAALLLIAVTLLTFTAVVAWLVLVVADPDAASPTSREFDQPGALDRPRPIACSSSR
jgi:hypothetical protein